MIFVRLSVIIIVLPSLNEKHHLLKQIISERFDTNDIVQQT